MDRQNTPDMRDKRYCREINGEICVAGRLAEEIFICPTTEMKDWRNEGMPVVKEKGRNWYPVDRCHAWFAGTLEGGEGGA